MHHTLKTKAKFQLVVVESCLCQNLVGESLLSQNYLALEIQLVRTHQSPKAVPFLGDSTDPGIWVNTQTHLKVGSLEIFLKIRPVREHASFHSRNNHLHL